MECLEWALGIVIKQLIAMGWMKAEKAAARAAHESEIDAKAKAIAKEMQDAKTQDELDQADRNVLGG